MIVWKPLYWIARRHEQSGRLKKAEHLYSYLYKSGETNNPKVLFRLGHVLFTEHRYAESKEYLEQAVRLAPNNAEWNYRLGFVQEKLKKNELAEATYARAIELDDSVGQWYYRRGVTLTNMRKHAEAAEAYRTAIQREPNEVRYHDALAKAVRGQSVASWKELEVLQSGAVHHESDVDWQLRLAQVLESLNRYDEASEFFSKAAALEPKRAFLHYRLGYALERSGRMAESARAFDMAIELDSRLGSEQFGIGVFHEARSLWKSAADSYIHFANDRIYVDYHLHERIARCLEKLGDWKSAVKYRKSALEQRPDSKTAHLNYARTLERSKDSKLAVEAYSFILDNTSDTHAQWRFRYARLLAEMEDYAHAAEQYLRAVGQTKLFASMPERNGIGSTDDIASIDSCTLNQESPNGSFSVNEYANQILEESTRQALSTNNLAILDSANKLACDLDRHDIKQRLNAQGYLCDASSRRIIDHAVGLYHREAYREICNAMKALPSSVKAGNTHDIPGYPKGKWTAESLEYYEFRENLAIEQNVILYESHMGKSIDCNPFAIFKEIINEDEYADYIHIWTIGPGCAIPPEARNRHNVILVKHGTRLYRRYLATAKYLINNVTFQNYFIRRNDQRYLNTWHGTPFKTLGKDMRGTVLQHSNVTRNFLQATHILSPDAHTTRVIAQSYDTEHLLTAKVAELGYPRNDFAINLNHKRKAEILDQLNVSRDPERPVVLYAPTWRGEVGESKFALSKLHQDLEALSSTGAQIIFRAHPITESLLSGMDFGVVTVPREINSNELLGAVDLVITDYSSIAFDAKACQTPVYLYTYDIEEYKLERGLYFEPDQISEFVYDTIDALCAAIEDGVGLRSVDYGSSETAVVGSWPEDGHSASRAVQFFFAEDTQYLVSATGKSKISILVRASLIPNGVTSAFLNLVHQLDPDKYAITLLVDAKVTAQDDQRLSKFAELPNHVRVVGRIGPRSALVDEKWQESLLSRQHNLWSEDSWNVYYCSYRREYERIFGSTRFDYVIEYDGYSLFWASLLACAHPKRGSLMYLHSEMYQEWLSRAAYLEGIFRIYPSFDRLVCVSNTLAELNSEMLASSFGVDARKFVGGGNFLNPASLDQLANEALDDDVVAWLGDSSHFLVTVGRISPEKDQMKLVKAFRVVANGNRRARLVIVGDGPQYSELAALIKELDLESNVLLAGYRSNPFPLMRCSSGFVLSSNHEGQPMVLLEALALGVPVLSTDIVGARALLGDRLGTLVPNSVDDLAVGIETLIRKRKAAANFDIYGYNADLLRKFETEILANDQP